MSADKPFEGIIPGELLDSLRSKRCVLFAGAGLSAQVKRSSGRPLPTWPLFLTELLDWGLAHNIRFWGEPEDIRQMITAGDLLMAAQELQERITAPAIGDFVQSVFRDSRVRPGTLHKLLPDIPFRAVLTSNYDSLLEGAYAIASHGSIPPVLTQHDLSANPSLLRRGAFFIFKLHGHMDRPDSIVLGSRDYQDLLFQSPRYRQFLETLFATHTVLFLGFGAADPDLDNVLDRLAALYSRTLDRHFILLPSGRMNPTQKRRLALDRRLEVIEYFVDLSHSQVLAFLRELRRQLSAGVTGVIPATKMARAPVVFISAAMSDEYVVRRLTTFLREHDYLPWAAAADIQPAEDVRQKIGEALAAADCVIVVLTAAGARSAWVRYEAEAAMVREVTGQTVVVPIVIGDYRAVDVPAYFRDRLHLRLGEQFSDDDLQPLLSILGRVRDMGEHTDDVQQ